MNVTDLLAENLKRFATEKLVVSQFPIKVLVVDDDATDAELLGKKLNEIGCLVTITNDSTNAIQKISETIPYNRVFVDLKFPNEDGIQIIRKIRQICPTMPITIVSGYITPTIRSVAEALKFGVIEKGADIAVLRRAISA